MEKDLITVMMHPIRIRIIQELGLKGSATTKEIQAACGEIAQTTLYRHIKELLKYDFIKVVDENNVNGIIEKVYGINRNIGKEIQENPGRFSSDEYLQMFSQYIVAILTDFRTYMSTNDDTSNITDHVGFTSSSLFLSDEEGDEMMKEIKASIIKRMENPPAENRKLIKLSTIIMHIVDGDK